MKKLLTLLTLMAATLAIPATSSLCCNATAANKPGTFTTGDKTFLLNGQPFVVKAAEVHYPRIPRPYWEHRIQMCKALGMNTLCLYVFWNIHEQREGQFDFTGNNDVAEFCRLAQKNGMYVIVRPGPYVCAEWEMGGLPWWLLKKKDIRLRERDPYFMERVKIFEEKVGEQLKPLTIQNGGPIIMIQVENEYGSANIDQQFRRLGELRPNAPKMCSEFWSGWFDKWGARHETRPAKDMVEGMDEMLSKGISFSLYMTHGGTSFGHWAGANSPGFAPDVTSYDYDAPINEWGLATPKFWELRKMMEKYNDGKKMPAVPKAPMSIITVPKFEVKEFAALVKANRKKASGIKTFEEMDMGWGTMIYRTRMPEIPTQSLLTAEIHDFAQVFIEGKYIGKIDRVKNEKSLTLPPVKKDNELVILVEGMGRINFGRAIKDFKGIIGDVVISADDGDTEMTWKPLKWTSEAIDDSYETAVETFSRDMLEGYFYKHLVSRPGYYRGTFNLSKVGDTFLNFETWGKGQVWVNGHALGRIWSIGPQQTLYVPGCWLKKGKNEIIILDVVGPKERVVWGQAEPELNKLQLEKSNKHNNIGDKPDLNSATPIATGTFKAGNGWQTFPFSPAKGRYVAIEILSTQKDGDRAAIAELYLQSGSKRLSREPWTVKYANSEEENGNHTGDKVFDLQESTYWQTEKSASTPHLLVIDLGSEQTVNALEYLPRAEQGAPGSVKNFKIYVY